MIPILYEKTETTFNTNGLGRLSDVINCVVTEERNGQYECQFDYPINGINFDKITDGRIIAVVHDDNGDIQPFDIYHRTEPINGVVTFYANHISYRLSENVSAPFTAASCSAALTGLGTNAVLPNTFTFATDKGTAADFALEVPTSIRSALGGVEGSILDVYGGEYKFDKFSVYLYNRRGTDTGVAIRYGVNLVEYEDDIDHADTFNAAVPYWTGTDPDTNEMTTVIGNVVDSGEALYSGRTVAVPMDLTSYFETKPTEAQLETMAASIMASNEPWLPAETITLNFIPLWQTDEYKNVAAAQHLNLCDTATIYFAPYNKAARMKVVRTVYNVLLERYDEIEFGQLQTTLAQAINASIEKQVKEQAGEIIGIGQIASNTNQHFWFEGTGPDTGAHIAETARDVFVADRANGGPNLLARSNGLAVRDGTTELSRFAANGVQIGQDSEGRVIVGQSSIDMYTPDNNLGVQLKTVPDLYDNPVDVVAVGGAAGWVGDKGHRLQLESRFGAEAGLTAYAADGQQADLSVSAAEWDSNENEYVITGKLTVQHNDVELWSDHDIKLSTGAAGLANRNVKVDNGVSCLDGGGYSLIRGDGGIYQIGAYGSDEYGHCERVHINCRHHTELGNQFQVLGRYTSGGNFTSYAYIRAGVDSTSEFVKLPPVWNRSVNNRAVYVSSDGTLGTTSSSKRWKHFIRRFTEPEHKREKRRIIDGIRKIPVALFKYKSKHMGEDFDYNADILGMIAEDVAEALPEAAIHNKDNPELIDDWDIRQVVPAVLLLAQEAMNETERLRSEVETLKDRVKTLEMEAKK